MIHRLMLVTSMLAWCGLARAQDPADGMQNAVQSQIAPLVTGAVNDFYARIGQPKPESVEVKTHADLETGGGEPKIRALDLHVTLRTDQPPAVVREARQALLRMLKGNGYRVEGEAPADGDMRPLAVLTLDAEVPTASAGHSGTKEYTVFGLLAGGALVFLAFGIYLLTAPLRRKGQVAKKGRPRPAAGSGAGASVDLPPLPAPRAEPSVGLPPVPGSTGPSVALDLGGRPQAAPGDWPSTRSSAKPAPGDWPSTRASAKPPVSPSITPQPSLSGPGASKPLTSPSSLPVAEKPASSLPPTPALAQAVKGKPGAPSPSKRPAADLNLSQESGPETPGPETPRPRVAATLVGAAARGPASELTARMPLGVSGRGETPAGSTRPTLPTPPGAKTPGALTTPPGKSGELDLAILSLQPQAVVRQAFAGLPFEKALSVLAGVDAPTRRLIIEKLQLKAPVRERLERELAQLPQGPGLA